jgi:undecaprenyl-diphosphatase
VVVGGAQVLALAPGVSRSGITISGGLFSGLDFEAAARFAFLVAAPILAGSGLLEGYKLVKHGIPHQFLQIFLPGFILAAVVGLIAIRFMLRYLRRGTLSPFIIYRFAVAAVVLIVLAAK